MRPDTELGDFSTGSYIGGAGEYRWCYNLLVSRVWLSLRDITPLPMYSFKLETVIALAWIKGVVYKNRHMVRVRVAF